MQSRLVHVVTPREGLESLTLTVDASAVKPGMPCTVTHPNDRYAASVVEVAPSGASVVVLYDSRDERARFTWRTGADGVGYFAAAGCSSPRLLLGVAEDYLCPEI